MTTNSRTAMQPQRIFSIALLLAMTAWPGSAAFAASDMSRDIKTTKHRADAPKPLQAARPRQPVACAEFGAGFVRMPGSDSCVRVGGAIDIGVGGTR